MTEIDYKFDTLQGRFEELHCGVTLLRREVADLRAEMRDMARRQGQDFRLLAIVILAIVWIVVFGLVSKGFGWVH